MRTGAVSALDLLEHTVDIGQRKVMSRRRANHFELLPHACVRFTAARQIESRTHSAMDMLRERATG